VWLLYVDRSMLLHVKGAWHGTVHAGAMCHAASVARQRPVRSTCTACIPSAPQTQLLTSHPPGTPTHLLLQLTGAPSGACCLALHLLLPASLPTEGCQKSRHHQLKGQQQQCVTCISNNRRSGRRAVMAHMLHQCTALYMHICDARVPLQAGLDAHQANKSHGDNLCTRVVPSDTRLLVTPRVLLTG
jgi:hypothetical protein